MIHVVLCWCVYTFKGEKRSSTLYRLLSADKDVLLLFLQADRITSRLAIKSARLEPDHMAVARSTVVCIVGEPVASVLSRLSFYLVPGFMELSLVQEGLALDKGML